MFDASFNYISQNRSLDKEYPQGDENDLSTGSSIPLTGFAVDNKVPDSDKNNAPLADSTVSDKPLARQDSTISDKPLVHHPDSLRTAKDSNLALADSLRSISADSMRIDSMMIDSTARLEYFRYHRDDEPAVQFDPKKPSAFFAQPSSSSIFRSVALDSTGQYVIMRETAGGVDIRAPLKIPVDEYIKMRMNSLNRDLWEQLGYKYDLKAGNKDIGQFITDITNIEIPLPSTSFLSIFGPPKISLKFNGAVDIHGAWRTETTEGITASALGNTRNEPDFKQQVQINVNGTIGDKLTIGADWNTERTFEYENQLKIKYTGYDDEIIKSIEAGNVSLQTSPLVGGSEALFGVKAQMQMGPLTLTALASQKKGEVKEVSVNSGSQSQTFEIHAYEYSTNHFFLDTVYADTRPDFNFFNRYYGHASAQYNQNMQYYTVSQLQVWKSVTGQENSNPNARVVNAYINLGPRTANQNYPDSLRASPNLQTEPGKRVIGNKFILLTVGTDYDINEATGVITFNTQIQDNDAVAVAYTIQGNNASSTSDDLYYGELTNSDQADTTKTLILKLVKPPNLQPSYKTAWKLQLKNIYPVKGRDVKKEGFKLDIKYRIEGSDPVNELGGVKLLQAFGLDKTDESQTSSTPDGAFDFIPNKTIFTNTGEIIFPVLQPFGEEFPTSLTDSLKYSAIYDTTANFAAQDRAKDKFTLVGEYSASVSSVYNIGFNVVENSVKVTLGGNQLVEGTDYTVDYNIGQVVIRRDDALIPGADLKITYEQNDLFALASKTLLGFRGIFDFSKRTKLGFSYLNLNQQTLSDKVRIGEEPMSNTIMGVDMQTGIDFPFITKALDHIISTKTMSSLSLKGEYAYLSPDHNTKKSTIEGDGGKSIAYIDDFEGAKRTIPLGVAYGSWHDISAPVDLPDLSSNLTNAEKVRYKAKTFWYNPTKQDVTVKDIYGDRKQVSRDQQLVTVLDLVYLPTQRGAYNYDPRITDNPMQNWGGFMKALSSSANNLITENIESIEFWVHIDDAPVGSKLYIDLGQIDEDVLPDGKLNTEDINNNLLIDNGEDTGIDGLTDEQERLKYPNLGDDPSGDDYYFNNGSGDYSSINGTEGNAKSIDIGRLPDTEDLNGNNYLDRVNSYFHYEIPIDTNAATNQYVQGGGGSKGWVQIKIPLKDFKTKVGNPDFSNVEAIRFYLSGVSQEVHLRFVDMNLVGNQWQKAPIKGVADVRQDTVLTVSTISIEDNPDYYSPPGVARERDKTKPDENVYKNEQSLDLVLKKLSDGDKREVVKYLVRSLDVFNYKEMKLYLHGDLKNSDKASVSYYNDANDYGAEVYLRFGSDTSNYYEYRQPIQAGWNEVSLVFDKLTAIKQNRTKVDSLYTLPLEGEPGHYYGVLGNPTLTRISFFTIGILNPSNKGTPGQAVSGELWVNELRVLDANNSSGWAYSGSANLQLADLMNVSFNMQQQNPYFHKLNDRFGNREDNKNWGLSVDLDLLKLIPLNLSGSNFRISYQHSETLADPLYLPSTDIQVDEAATELTDKLTKQGVDEQTIQRAVDSLRNTSKTLAVSESWNVANLHFKIPTSLWYIRDIFNNLSWNFNYNKTSNRSPTVVKSNSWIWNAGSNYVLNLSRDYYFKPAGIPYIGDVLNLFSDYKDLKIYFVPQTITASIQAQRKWSYLLGRTIGATPSVQRDFTTQRAGAFSWQITEGGFLNLTMNYNFSISSSLSYLLMDDDRERSESEIWHDILTKDKFGRDFNYSQTLDFKLAPKFPSIWNIARFVSINAGYSVQYTWQNNFLETELGRSAMYSSRMNLGMNLKLKSLFDPLFTEEKPRTQTQRRGNEPSAKITHSSGRGRGAGRNLPSGKREGIENDTTKSEAADSLNTEIKDPEIKNPETENPIVQEGDKMSTIDAGLIMLKMLVKTVFFDYEMINIGFDQSTSYGGGALKSEATGFNNFWGFNQDFDKGPSRAFMLGLSNNIGPRAANGNLTDNYTQQNTLSLRTSRPLWEGAQIDINWKVGWGINKSTRLTTDSLGMPTITGITSTTTIDRTFMSFPSSLFLSVFKTGIKQVAALYDPNAANKNQSLSSAFLKGFESLPLLANVPFLKDVSKYIPRPNWNITWNGLEKLPLFNFATRVSFNHAYTSDYSEGLKVNPDGTQEIQSQRIDYGFSPLAGFNFTFDKFLKGNLTATAKYSTKTAYALGASTRNITETFSKDINVSASFSKSGFELPLFGLSLKNDLEISLSYTSGQNSSVIFNMDQFNEKGIPQDGTTRTSIEPRIKYVMSSRVTLALFYRRTSVEPQGASRIPPSTTNEAGVDVHISIQ